MKELINPPAVVKPAEDLAALAKHIRQGHEEGGRLRGRRAQVALQTGRWLSQAKGLVLGGRRQGGWAGWLEKNLPEISRTQVWRYTKLAELVSRRNELAGDEEALADAWEGLQGHAPAKSDEADAEPPIPADREMPCEASDPAAPVGEGGAGAGDAPAGDGRPGEGHEAGGAEEAEPDPRAEEGLAAARRFCAAQATFFGDLLGEQAEGTEKFDLLQKPPLRKRLADDRQKLLGAMLGATGRLLGYLRRSGCKEPWVVEACKLMGKHGLGK